MAHRTTRSSEREELLHTIETVHAAGLKAELWLEALKSTAGLLGGAAATLEVFAMPSQVPKEFHSAGIPHTGEIEYFEHYAPLSPRAAYAFRNPREDMFWDYKFIDETAMDRDPFYAKLLPQSDLRYYLGGQLYRTTDEIAAVSIHRTQKQGHVGAHEFRLMARLVPHFRQALDTSMRLKRANAFAHSLEVALDWLADGVALIDEDGKILYANHSLQAMARRGDGISIHHREFDFAASLARHRFVENLASIAGLTDESSTLAAPRDFAAARPGGAAPYLVSLRPVTESVQPHRADRRAVAIMFVRDPQGGNTAALRLLREIFGLTQAEASLAEAIQSGASLDRYARERRLSLNTVYTHLRRLKEKTGCKRMAELIHMLKDLRVPLRIE